MVKQTGDFSPNVFLIEQYKNYVIYIELSFPFELFIFKGY